MKPTNRTYDRVLRYVAEQPWAILPSTLAIMREVLRMRASGFKFTPDELAERIGADEPAAAAGSGSQPAAGIAVLPVWGVIGHRANELRDISSRVGTSTEILGAQIEQLVADPNVGAIVLDINSPGGGVFGVQEVADQIRQASKKKPIIGVANALAASAAYWIAAACTELVVTPSGMVGSIGVFSIHEDHSKELEELGVNVSLIKAGKFKAEDHPFGALTDEARANIQTRIDTYYAQFTKSVAKGRGVALDQVRGGFGEGRVVDAASAVRLGMADRVGTMDDVIGDLVSGRDLAALSAAADLRCAAFVDDSDPIQDEIGVDLAANGTSDESVVFASDKETAENVLADAVAIATAETPEMQQRRLKLRLLELS